MICNYDGTDLAKVLAYFQFIGEEPGSYDFNICCPFHDDPNPSLRVTLSNGRWYCFGCGLGGNVYDFIRCAYPELDELQALVVLERILHDKRVKDIRIRRQKKDRKNNEHQLLCAKDYYYGLRTNDWYRPKNQEEREALAYMKARGFGERSLTLCRCKVNPYNRAYPILFPIFDNGMFSGWVARTTRATVEAQRKYLYNEGFRKRTTLCGTYANGSVVYLCEGFLDYLSLRTKGRRKNVVAILGWHLADGQLEKLKQKHVTKVVCALDNPEIDRAGGKGLQLLKRFFDVVPFVYPDGVKDPGEMSVVQIRKAIHETERKL